MATVRRQNRRSPSLEHVNLEFVRREHTTYLRREEHECERITGETRVSTTFSRKNIHRRTAESFQKILGMLSRWRLKSKLRRAPCKVSGTCPNYVTYANPKLARVSVLGASQGYRASSLDCAASA